MQALDALRVDEYDADDSASVEASRLVLNAAHAVDAPFLPPLTLFRRTMDLRYGWDGSPERHLLLWVDDRPVAVVDVELGEWDNRDLAWFDLFVHPEHRRRGYGSRLLAGARARARAAAGPDEVRWLPAGRRRDRAIRRCGTASTGGAGDLSSAGASRAATGAGRAGRRRGRAVRHRLRAGPLEGHAPEDTASRDARASSPPRSTTPRSTTWTSRTRCSRSTGSATTTTPRRVRLPAATGSSPGTGGPVRPAGHTAVVVDAETARARPPARHRGGPGATAATGSGCCSRPRCCAGSPRPSPR